ncbi:hypothetical protein ECARS42123_5097, partial [Escherichia coli ARS4.2123]
MHTPPPPR